VGLATGLQAGPFAGKPLLSAPSELEECAQRQTGVDALLHCAFPVGSVNELGRLRKFCSLIILIVNWITRSTDPHAIILSPSPGDLDSYLDAYFAAGGPTGVDGIRLHAYNATPEKVNEYVTNIKQIAAEYGLTSKPFWNTEGSSGASGLPLGQRGPCPEHLDPVKEKSALESLDRYIV